MMQTINKDNNNNRSNITKGGADDLVTSAMENCLMLLSTKAAAAAAAAQTTVLGAANDVGRTYACKTCGRRFDSFQALGGHRASHNKLKPAAVAGGNGSGDSEKPKSHPCLICGVEFPIGQALGGHMRRHRAVVAAVSGGGSTVTTEVSVENSDGYSNVKNKVVENVKKRKNNDVLDGEVEKVIKKLSREEVCLDLNMSFIPWVKKKWEEHESEIEEGEIVEQEADEEEYDFLKLELRQPIN